MGYACPVCGDPQADAEHLANHLAFTALLRGGEHEDWLDEHAPGWEADGEADLAARVTERADPVEFPQVFEDTTGDDHDHEHAHGHEAHGEGRGVHPMSEPAGGMDDETRRVIAEAREMTRRMREGDEKRGDGEAGDENGADE